MAFRVTGGELFEDIVAREFYSEADARWTKYRFIHGMSSRQRRIILSYSAIVSSKFLKA